MGSENMHAPPLRGYVTMRQVQKGILDLVVLSLTRSRRLFTR